MSKLRAVILDVDGTLVDSNDQHAQAWVDTLAEFGRPVEFAKVRRLIGMGGDKLLPEVTGISTDAPDGQRISKRRKEIFHQRYLASIVPFPKVRELLERMKAAGLRLVVATSAEQEQLEPLLRIAGVTDLLEDKTSSSDAENSKPDPDIVQAALRKLQVPPAEAVMLGDTPYDIEAAARAGIHTIALRSGGWNDEDLREAVAIYDDPADLLRNFDSSPLAQWDDGAR
jgi:HAD superfamily hydrolase (TIGR01509 family)